MTDERFLAEIKAFLKRHSMAPTAFGTRAMKDPALVSLIERGRSLTLRNANRVLDFMDAYERSAPSSSKAMRSPNARARKVVP